MDRVLLNEDSTYLGVRSIPFISLILMSETDVSFPIAKAIEFVGENSTYQKTRLAWICIALVSISALNSFLPLTLTSTQTILYFFASAAGQLVCPLYFQIPLTTKYIVLSSLVAAFSVNRIPFIETLAFIGLGFFGRGLNISSFIYINEIGGEKWRAWCFMVMFIVWGSAPFTLALTKSLHTPDWLWLLLFVTVPHIAVYWKIGKGWQNSPYYYCQVKGDFKAARQVLNTMAFENSRGQFRDPIQGENDDKNINIEHKKYTYFDLLFLNAIKKITIPLAMLWFYRQFVYYGSFMILPYLGEEQSKNLILLSVSEIVAALMSIPIILKVKRINSFFGFSALICLSCLIVSFFRIPEWCLPKGQGCFQKFIYRSSAMVIRFSVSLIGSVLMNYTVEVFPSKIRNLGFGICLGAASIGSVLMPLFVELLVVMNLSPFICFSLLSMLILYMIPQLPQTQGKITNKRPSEMQGSDDPIIILNM